ncbi:MAG: hypothetical protein ACRDDZ_04680 [Marinifilaceae bacterium]
MKTQIELPSNRVHQKTNISKLIANIAICLLSIFVLYYINTSTIDNTGATYMFLAFASIVGLVVGICNIFTAPKLMVYTPTNSKIHIYHFEFGINDYAKTKEILNTGNLHDLLQLEKSDGLSIRLEIAISNDEQLVAYQYFKYIPYEYVPDSDIIYLDWKTAKLFCGVK